MRCHAIQISRYQLESPNRSEMTAMPNSHSTRLCAPWRRRAAARSVPCRGSTISSASMRTNPPASVQLASDCRVASSEKVFTEDSARKEACGSVAILAAKRQGIDDDYGCATKRNEALAGL